MISLHTPYVIKQPIETSILFINMARMLILILQVKYDKFCWKMVKNRFYYERKYINAYIFKIWCFKILLLTRVDSSVMHETRVGTERTHGSSICEGPVLISPFLLKGM